MIVEKLKEISEANGWHWNYGLGHWQNLGDYETDSELPFVDRKKYFLLLWKDAVKKFDEYGTCIETSFDGEFFFGVRSSIDAADYNTKYDIHIKNLEVELEKFLDGISICDEFTIVSWKATEVENEYDTNLDGLKVKFMIDHA